MEEGKASPAAGSLSSQRCLVDLDDDDDAAIKEEEVDEKVHFFHIFVILKLKIRDFPKICPCILPCFPFVGSKNGNENFRQARIYNFRF